METTTTTTAPRLAYAIRYEMATTAAKRLRRWINAHDAWMSEAARRCRGDEPRNVRMPSKASKYRAYSDASQMRRYLDLGTKQESTVDDLRMTLAAFAVVATRGPDE